MLAKLRPKLTYANVVSTLCLFILLGGSSYAAVKLGKNAVKTKNIAANAVTSPKVKDGSLLSQDFKAGQLPTGSKGDIGPPGQNGTNGAKGDPGPTAGTANSTRLGPQPFPDTDMLTATIITPTGGRLLVTGDVDPNPGSTFNCSSTTLGICQVAVGLYVDNTPVPKTNGILGQCGGGGPCSSPGVINHYYASGLTASAVTPGAHTVKVARTTEIGVLSSFGGTQTTVNAVLLGGS